MQFLRKAFAIGFLFILSFGLPKIFLKYIIFSYSNSEGSAENIVANAITFFLWLLLIRFCVWLIDTTSTDKKFLSYSFPLQTNILTPSITGFLLGLASAVNYYKQ